MIEVMKRLVKRIDVDTWYLMGLLVANLVATAYLVKFGVLIYETDDDFAMSAIASGVFGKQYNCHLVYSKYALGVLIQLISILHKAWNWYVVLQYILISVSCTMIFYVLSRKTNYGIGFATNTFFWIFIIYDQISSIQFTRTAFLCSAVGLMLLLVYLKGSTKGYLIGGSILALLGYMYREDSFFVIGMYWGICVVVTLIFSHDKRKMLKRSLYIGGILGAGLLSIIIVERNAYNSPDWKAYLKYNVVRSNAKDYGVPSYENHKEEYSEIGFSSNDVLMFSRWAFDDKEKFSYENLKRVAEMRETERMPLTAEENEHIWDTILSHCRKNLLFIVVVASLAISLVRKKGWEAKLANVLISAVAIALNFYLLHKGRFPVRVEYGVWVGAAIFSAFMLISDVKEKSGSERTDSLRVCIASVIVLFLFVWTGVYLNREWTNEEDENYILEKELLSASNANNSYLLDNMSVGMIYRNHKPTRCPESFMANYMYQGGWTCRSPLHEYKAASLDIENTYSDLLSKSDYYYISRNGPDMILKYIQENINENARVSLVKQSGRFCFYRFYIEE